MGQSDLILVQWDELGRDLAQRLPQETFEHLIEALQAIGRAELGDVVDGVYALHEMALHGRSNATVDELLALIESRVREVRHHETLRLVRLVGVCRTRRLRSV
jgi:hypothetical protein